MNQPSVKHATSIRYRVLVVSMLMAFVLYLHRVCLGEVVKSESFKSDFDFSKERIGEILGAFFFAYALCQVPAGWFSDRWGARRMLAGYTAAWSLLTGLTGFATGALGLILARQGMGVAQAGAYPTSSAVIRKWFPATQRGRASSLVSIGGRLGGTLAPVFTTALILGLGDWRMTMYAFAILGVVVAIAYYFVVRDSPESHPWCNEEEVALVGRELKTAGEAPLGIGVVVMRCIGSPSLWLNAISQFCINIGWAFLITWLPTFLNDVKKVDTAEGAMMVSGILAMGMLGQFVGGWATDLSVKLLGLRFGRVLPITAATWLAGSAYFGCTVFDSVWAVVVCCAIVSFMNDVGNPSIWAFMQDIGGRGTATIFGWGNMWGNFGAAAVSIITPRLLAWGTERGWGDTPVFVFCGSAFFVAGLCALFMNPTKSIDR